MNDLLCAICLDAGPGSTPSVAATIIDGTAVCREHAIEILARHRREEMVRERVLKESLYKL